MAIKQEIFRGCLLGLAVGDAMGYTVDSRNLSEICRDYGPNGLLGYDLVNGYADVTSYTQIAAFTANGLLIGLTQQRLKGSMASPVRYIGLALKEWSRSQHYCTPERNFCWLSAVAEMKRRHCLDNRMLDVLAKGSLGTVEEPASNFSHGGALTEAVPIALLGDDLLLNSEKLDRLGAEAAALTHGDPEAFICAAALTHALSLLLHRPGISAEELLQDTVDAIQLQFGRAYLQTAKLWELLQMAKTLSQSDSIGPMEAMERLSCRSAAEILAGVFYACVTCHGDFDAAMITAVNHSGRSAAVGAITGAVLGAVLGEEAMPEFYLDCLEPTQYLLELADDMFHGCPMDMGSALFDGDWDRKYIYGGK